MTQMLAQREHDYFAETVICANCYIVAKDSHTPHRCTAYRRIRIFFKYSSFLSAKKGRPFLVSQIAEVLCVFLFSY